MLEALKNAFYMLRPDVQWKNPVMFIVEIGVVLIFFYILQAFFRGHTVIHDLVVADVGGEPRQHGDHGQRPGDGRYPRDDGNDADDQADDPERPRRPAEERVRRERQAAGVRDLVGQGVELAHRIEPVHQHHADEYEKESGAEPDRAGPPDVAGEQRPEPQHDEQRQPDHDEVEASTVRDQGFLERDGEVGLGALLVAHHQAEHQAAENRR